MSDVDRVYQELRGLIVSGELRGGEVVNQAEMVVKLGTSRGTLHQAVSRLVSERMLSLLPGRGVRVMRLSVHDLLEINQLRWLLEGFAGRVATDHVPEADLVALRRECDDVAAVVDDPARVEALDARLHALLAEHCGNQRMAEYIAQLDAEMSIARHSDVRAAPQQMVASVSDILDALIARDAGAVEREIRAHIDLFADGIRGVAGGVRR